MSFLSLKNISFSFEKSEIIKNFSLEIEEGSFTTLLGPSGSGKTTILKIISGFLNPNSGSVEIDGASQNGLPPHLRKIGMVFQDYALFPHLTVKQNLLYGLKVKKSFAQFGEAAGKKISRAEKKEKINLWLSEISSALALENLLERYPHELSGGQQQRVALGRALILRPKIILMDEPLSSLDAKLRLQVREELLEIQHKFKITTVYVTHDREEALSLSSKIAVINEGNLLQYGSPNEIYYEPKDKISASLTGGVNFIKRSDGIYLVRPEWFLPSEIGDGKIFGKITSLSFLGSVTRCKISSDCVEGRTLIADFPCTMKNSFSVGNDIWLSIVHEYKI